MSVDPASAARDLAAAILALREPRLQPRTLLAAARRVLRFPPDSLTPERAAWEFGFLQGIAVAHGVIKDRDVVR